MPDPACPAPKSSLAAEKLAPSEEKQPQTPNGNDKELASADTKRPRSSGHAYPDADLKNPEKPQTPNGKDTEVAPAGKKRPRPEDEDTVLPSPDPKRPRASDNESTRAAPGDLKRPRPSENEAPQSRPRKRPGGASRIATADKEAVLQRQHQREEEARRAATTRGVQDVVRQHYNAVPQRGRDWRKTDSRIKGLRAFNNWIKSTIIHKFSPGDAEDVQPLRVLDIGCGKGGDLGKWQQAPLPVLLYIGIDPAEVSIDQAKERYAEMRSRGGGRGGRGGFRGGRPQRTFDAEFFAQDAFGQSIGNIPLIRDVGYDPTGGSRWGSGGFDVVSMMFCMHYAFESEAKARGMLQNVAGALKKGGRFLGTIPNSDLIRSKVEEFHQKKETNPESQPNGNDKSDSETTLAEHERSGSDPPLDTNPPTDTSEPVANWGNSIYRVRFPGPTPHDGVFRPPFGWKYNYFMEEAVEVPEYVVPWEAFRALAEDFNLSLTYRRPFLDVWKEESSSPVFGPLSERMGVRDRETGEVRVGAEEMEACGFYLAFCLYKV